MLLLGAAMHTDAGVDTALEQWKRQFRLHGAAPGTLVGRVTAGSRTKSLGGAGGSARKGRSSSRAIDPTGKVRPRSTTPTEEGRHDRQRRYTRFRARAKRARDKSDPVTPAPALTPAHSVTPAQALTPGLAPALTPGLELAPGPAPAPAPLLPSAAGEKGDLIALALAPALLPPSAAGGEKGDL